MCVIKFPFLVTRSHVKMERGGKDQGWTGNGGETDLVKDYGCLGKI